MYKCYICDNKATEQGVRVHSDTRKAKGKVKAVMIQTPIPQLITQSKEGTKLEDAYLCNKCLGNLYTEIAESFKGRDKDE